MISPASPNHAGDEGPPKAGHHAFGNGGAQSMPAEGPSPVRTWPKEPQRGVRYTTPAGWRMVALSAQRYPREAGPGSWTRVMRVQSSGGRVTGRRYRHVYIGSWPPYAGCVPGWPGDCVVGSQGVDQLELFGDVA